MFRLAIIAMLCVSFALTGCVVPPPHHDGPRYDHYDGHRPPPPPPHHGGYRGGPRWH